MSELTTAMQSELAPCPFCGGPASYVMTFPGCERCAVVRRTAASWNTRSQHQPDDAAVERVGELLTVIQEGDRPLPWVVHSGCSYRRIASEPTPENGFRSFPDGNVLHAYRQRSDGHPDLSMSEDQLNALVEIINLLPAIVGKF